MPEHSSPYTPRSSEWAAAAGVDDSLERDDGLTLADLAEVEGRLIRQALYQALQQGERYVNPVTPLHPDPRTLRRRM